jgi:hypothetical protein
MAMLEPTDLTREKTLLDLYRLGRKFPHSKFNRRVALLMAALLTLYCYLQWDNTSILVTALRKTADVGLSFSTSILGFLIAGFTVFVTVTRVDIFVAMARVEYEYSGESYLKYNLVQFMLVFSHYIAYLFVCICFVLFAQPHGLVSTVTAQLLAISAYPCISTILYKLPVAIALVLLGAWTTYLVLLLKSFIYNTFQVITTTVLWELERPTRKTE